MKSKTFYRTNNCGELRSENIGSTVTLVGWVNRGRDLGGLTFIDLRDRYGITQLVFNMDTNAELCAVARKLGREYVIQITGVVAERSNKNNNIPTGNIEILVNTLEVLNASELPPFTMEDETDGGEELRMKYRYLDLRRPQMQRRIMLRAKMVKAVREYLDNNDFIEIETPNLIKSTPEGARDFIVPSRLQPGLFYALPQSPQIIKQLLMVAGMDRYYQIARCFRDEDLRGDRQPEFSQIDCEMSFVTQEDIWEMFEGMTKHVFQKTKNITLPDFMRLPYLDAIKFYGTDKPDLRFDCKITELNTVAGNSEFMVFNKVLDNKGLIACINAKGCSEYSRKQIDELTEFVKAPHRGAGGLIYIRFGKDGTIKSSVDKFFNQEQLKEIGKTCNAENGDLILIVADKIKTTRKVLGELRLEIAKRESWIDKNAWSVFWVVDMPLFEPDENTGEPIFAHHPFCAMHPDDVQFLDSDPLRIRAQSYDMVMNGNEILSGSIRIHNKELQEKIFTILGFSDEEKEKRFGFMVNAFKYGAPPHGGCAFGLDRWVMLMAGGETIRDVIPFPKNNAGRDLMMDAPGEVDSTQLIMVGIQLSEKEEK
ncbi:MAG: aspartate--tRNA ligase [Chitinophagales bacterium]|nr:aspartate--tRNA ligase [Bacteroidota bacterium]MBP8753081.1 aspartate--tRNA ligase [Chitinophagales bacterium]MBK8486859.1 aspartate--tRNA ligase [Bacteroidota bacterium]MBK8681243.1 aspartate--tRNA ligase [Bacteroidota bacterium]MBP9188121.1 aspartate--tRNA ligase [Chitinophagales bacterium]